jgi:hypothetical protein
MLRLVSLWFLLWVYALIWCWDCELCVKNKIKWLVSQSHCNTNTKGTRIWSKTLKRKMIRKKTIEIEFWIWRPFQKFLFFTLKMRIRNPEARSGRIILPALFFRSFSSALFTIQSTQLASQSHFPVSCWHSFWYSSISVSGHHYFVEKWALTLNLWIAFPKKRSWRWILTFRTLVSKLNVHEQRSTCTCSTQGHELFRHKQ